MKTTSFSISTKKGESQTVRFLVSQEHPWPDFNSNGSSIDWRNTGGLFPAYQQPATGIGSQYYCYLTIPGIEIPEGWNRTHLAGFSHRPGSYGTPEVTNPGTITYRGKDLGEMMVYFGSNPNWPDIKVRGHDAPSSSERDFVKSAIVPALREFIASNKADLKAEAVAAVKGAFAKKLGEARAQIDAMEKKVETAVY